MAQKLWRVVRSCVELGMRNPIQQIHDQGAGGNCNVVKEIIYPLGAEINVRKVPASTSARADCPSSCQSHEGECISVFCKAVAILPTLCLAWISMCCPSLGHTSLQIKLGDPTMSVLEIWGAEYQENDCLLLKQEDCAAFEAICARERCSMQASLCLLLLVVLPGWHALEAYHGVQLTEGVRITVSLLSECRCWVRLTAAGASRWWTPPPRLRRPPRWTSTWRR